MIRSKYSLQLDSVICARCGATSRSEDDTCPFCGADREGAIFTSDRQTLIEELPRAGWLVTMVRKNSLVYPSLREQEQGAPEPVVERRRVPVRTIAMGGIVVVGLGLGLMLHSNVRTPARPPALTAAQSAGGSIAPAGQAPGAVADGRGTPPGALIGSLPAAKSAGAAASGQVAASEANTQASRSAVVQAQPSTSVAMNSPSVVAKAATSSAASARTASAAPTNPAAPARTASADIARQSAPSASPSAPAHTTSAETAQQLATPADSTASARAAPADAVQQSGTPASPTAPTRTASADGVQQPAPTASPTAPARTASADVVQQPALEANPAAPPRTAASTQRPTVPTRTASDIRRSLASRDLAGARRQLQTVPASQQDSAEIQRLADRLTRLEGQRDAAIQRARNCAASKASTCVVRNANRALSIDARSPQALALLRHASSQPKTAPSAPPPKTYVAAGSPPKAIERPQTDDTQHKQSKFTLFGWGVPTVSKGRGEAH